MKSLFLSSALLVATLVGTATLAMPDAMMGDHAMGHPAKKNMMMKCEKMGQAKAMKNKACAAAMQKHDAMKPDAMKSDAMAPEAMGHK